MDEPMGDVLPDDSTLESLLDSEHEHIPNIIAINNDNAIILLIKTTPLYIMLIL